MAAVEDWALLVGRGVCRASTQMHIATVIVFLLASAEAGSVPVANRLRSLSELLHQAAGTSAEELPVPLLEQLRDALQQQLNDVDEEGLTRVHRSVLEQDVTRLDNLLCAGADSEAEAGLLKVAPMHLAILAGDQHTACLKRLLSSGASPNKPDAKGMTALHAASTLNMPNACEILTGAGASCDRRGPGGVRPLQLAAWSNAAEAAEVLIDKGADVDATDKRSRTACHAASAVDAPETLEVLLDGGADADRADGNGWRPLHYAVKSCNCADPACPRVRTLKLLLEHGARLDAPDAGGWSALHVAAEHNRVAPLQLLLRFACMPADTRRMRVPPSTVPLAWPRHSLAARVAAPSPLLMTASLVPLVQVWCRRQQRGPQLLPAHHPRSAFRGTRSDHHAACCGCGGGQK